MLNVQELLLFLVVSQRYTCVVMLSLCDTDDGYLEVENKSNNRFTCRDIAATSTVSWLLTDSYGNDVNLGTCPPPTSSQQSSCNASGLAPLFNSYRNSNDVSFLTVDAKVSGNPNSWAGLPLTCRTELRNYAKCFIDYIYPASNTSCKVQFTNNPWSASVQCNITKIFSQRGRYRCRVYENKESQLDKRLIANTSMSTTQTEVGAFSGTCTISSYLPPEGRYNYTVVLIPGEVEFPAVFMGNNEIRKPFTTPRHNCPEIIQEGQGIKCACSVNDYGSPSGILQWDNTGSTQLSLTNVTRGDTGRQFVCRLTWNNTDVWTVNYTLFITYPAVIISFKLNNVTNMTVTVDEHSPVAMLCEANGRPAPRVSLIDTHNQILSTVPGKDIFTADLKQEVTYHFLKILCQDSGNYKCEADNGVESDSKSVILLVSCSPRSFASDKPFPSANLKDKGIQLQFNLTAYPPPEVVNIAYLGQSGVTICIARPVQDKTVSANCAVVKGSLYSVVCTATVHNVTSDNAGIYRITVSNGLGQLDLVFEIKTNDEETQNEPSTTNDYSKGFASGIGVGVGVTVAVFAILHVAGVVWLWRRNWVLPCRDKKENSPVRSVCSAAGSDTPHEHEHSGAIYDGLYLHEVGKKSLYSSLSTESQDTKETTDYELATEAPSNQERQMHRQRRKEATVS